MGKIPTNVTPEEFGKYIEPHLSKAKRGFVCKIPLYKVFNYILYVLYTGCQWHMLPIDRLPSGKPEITYKGVYYRFSKWCKDGSFEKVCLRGRRFITASGNGRLTGHGNAFTEPCSRRPVFMKGATRNRLPESPILSP